MLFASAGIAMLGRWCLWVWCEAIMPRIPDPTHGFIVPMVIHGTTVYWPRSYEVANIVLTYVAILGGLCAVLVDAYSDPFGWRKRPYSK